MKILLLSVLSSVIFPGSSSFINETFSVNLRLKQSANSNPVTAIVEVKNISDLPVYVPEDRTWDYKWAFPYYIGNYIVEIQKKEYDGFELFPPKGSLDQSMPDEGSVKLYPNEVLIDSIEISHFYFLRKLPEGDYRVRVAFNVSPESHSVENVSNWVNFTIEPDASKY